MAQAVHAAIGFVVQAPEVAHSWYRDSNNVVCVAVPNEHALTELAAKAVSVGVGTWQFTESDLDDEVTAVAFAPGTAAAQLCKRLDLALREETLTT